MKQNNFLTNQFKSHVISQNNVDIDVVPGGNEEDLVHKGTVIKT